MPASVENLVLAWISGMPHTEGQGDTNSSLKSMTLPCKNNFATTWTKKQLLNSSQIRFSASVTAMAQSNTSVQWPASLCTAL